MGGPSFFRGLLHAPCFTVRLGGKKRKMSGRSGPRCGSTRGEGVIRWGRGAGRMAVAGSGTVLHGVRTLFGAGAVGALSDALLVERFARGRDPASVFEAIVARHGPMGLGVCRRVLRDEHDADDAFQATFLVLAKKARGLGRPERLGCWLYGVAYRVALKARAGAARRRAREGPLAGIDA